MLCSVCVMRKHVLLLVSLLTVIWPWRMQKSSPIDPLNDFVSAAEQKHKETRFLCPVAAPLNDKGHHHRLP